MTRARDTADTQDNLGGAVAPFVAGKNKIINGDLNFWARGTTFTASNAYTADRFIAFHDGTVSTTTSQQTFALGTAPVAGYEGQYFIRKATTSQSGGTYNTIQQPIESVRTFAGQTIIVSFWAKAATAQNITVSVNQDFGSSGSPSATVTNTSGNIALTTSWVRNTYSLSLASIAGKTITTGDKLVVAFNMPLNTASTIDIWGVQVEAGSVATPFTTASGSIGGELALCQRYYYRAVSGAAYGQFGGNPAYTTGTVSPAIAFPVVMRTVPTAVDTTGVGGFILENNSSVSASAFTSIAINTSVTTSQLGVIDIVKSGAFTTGIFYKLIANNSSSAFIGFSAEL